MGDKIADVVVHIDETLTTDQLNSLVGAIRGLDGVVSAGTQDRPHLVTVAYNPDNVNSKAILERVKSEGCHAELIGI